MEDLKNKVITFEEFKVDLLQKAKDASACSDGYGPAEASETKEELLKVIKDNITWCFREGVLTTESLSAYYSESELAAENIYISGRRQVKGIAAIALGNSTVEALDNSTVEALDNSTVEALDNSTVEAWGNSTVEAWGNSTVEAWGNSTVEAWGNSTVEAWGNSTVEAWGNSTVEAWGNSTVEAWGNSTVKAWDNSTVKALGNSYTLFFNSREKHTISDSAILKDYYKKKIYIKKSSHEIIEVE